LRNLMELNKTIEGAKTVQRVARFSAFSLRLRGFSSTRPPRSRWLSLEGAWD
jgi:hypothetical protein